MLQRTVVELHDVLALRASPVQSPGQVDQNDVEATRTETQVECFDIDNHFIPDVAGADQPDIGPGSTGLPVNLDLERPGRDDNSTSEFQHVALASTRTASHTSSISTRFSLGTHS